MSYCRWQLFIGVRKAGFHCNCLEKAYQERKHFWKLAILVDFCLLLAR